MEKLLPEKAELMQQEEQTFKVHIKNYSTHKENIKHGTKQIF